MGEDSGDPDKMPFLSNGSHAFACWLLIHRPRTDHLTRPFALLGGCFVVWFVVVFKFTLLLHLCFMSNVLTEGRTARDTNPSSRRQKKNCVLCPMI